MKTLKKPAKPCILFPIRPFAEEVPAHVKDEDLPWYPRPLPWKAVVPPGVSDEDLQESDGEPMESYWHVLAMYLLLDVTECHLQPRRDFFAGGNMFIYYPTRRKKTGILGPDYFLVWGVDHDKDREKWVVWAEDGHYPDVIIELGSKSTLKNDKTGKKATYGKEFRTHEYFIYDPKTETFWGWRLVDGRYRRIKPNEHGWLRCEELGLWLGTWQGAFKTKQGLYPRFYDDHGKLVPTFDELAEQKAEEAERRAKAEKQRADAEKQRADQAEAELARLRGQQGTNGRRKK